jgi:hypothetical protein
MCVKIEFYSHNPKNLNANMIDLCCRWLYQPARADGKSRMLLLGILVLDNSQISPFIDRLKQVKAGLYVGSHQNILSGFFNCHNSRHFLHPNIFAKSFPALGGNLFGQ